MDDERLTRLETMAAFHEDTIQDLNDVILRQQRQIDLLEEKVEMLLKREKDAGEMSTADRMEEPLPPHY